jgi:hypothetical protein
MREIEILHFQPTPPSTLLNEANDERPALLKQRITQSRKQQAERGNEARGTRNERTTDQLFKISRRRGYTGYNVVIRR